MIKRNSKIRRNSETELIDEQLEKLEHLLVTISVWNDKSDEVQDQPRVQLKGLLTKIKGISSHRWGIIEDCGHLIFDTRQDDVYISNTRRSNVVGKLHKQISILVNFPKKYFGN